MQLPEHLHFPSRAELIVTADSIHARLYLLGGDRVEELDGVTIPREDLSDNEGSFTSSDGSRVSGPGADRDDTPRLIKFVKEVSSHIDNLVRLHGIQSIHLVMPSEVEHLMSQHVSSEAKALLGTTMHLNLMKTPINEILDQLFA